MIKRRSNRRAAVWRKFLVVLAILALLLLVIVPITLRVIGGRITARWNAVAAQMRAAGEPVTLVELGAALPPIPDDENLALEFAPLEAKLRAVSRDTFGKSILAFNRQIDSFGALHAEPVDETRVFLERHEETLRHLRTLPTDGRGRLKRDWSAPALELPVAKIDTHLSGAKLAVAHAAISLIATRRDEVAHDIEVCWSMSAVLAGEPFMLSALLRLSCDALALDLIEAVLATGTAQPAEIEAWTEHLDIVVTENRTLWPLRNERAFAITACDPSLATGGASRSLFVTDLNRLKIAELFGPMIEVHDDPVELLRAARRARAELDSLPGTRYALTLMVTSPSFESFAERSILWVAETACTRLALAAERYRMENGSLPDTLDALVPRYINAIPIDPFDGKPIKLAVTANGITIYSAFTKGSESNPSGTDPTEPDSNASFRLYRLEHRRPPRIIPAEGDE